jgi:hypothetical protein
MSHPSKRKGTAFEREIVELAKLYELAAERAWGSDGRSKGWKEVVDVMVEGQWRIQCKIRHQFAKDIFPSGEVDIQMIRQDRGEAHAVIRAELLFSLLKQLKANSNAVQPETDDLKDDPGVTEGET